MKRISIERTLTLESYHLKASRDLVPKATAWISMHTSNCLLNIKP